MPLKSQRKKIKKPVKYEATQDMLVTNEPTMGPVVSIMTFDNIEQAVEMANATRFGFQVDAFTSNLSNAYFLSENIKAGAVYINEATSCWDEMAPFGGRQAKR